MTQDDIIRMAREVGATPYTNRHYPDRPTHTFTVEQLERFSAFVADAEAKRIHGEGMVTVGHMREQIAAEREACALMCETEAANPSCLWEEPGCWAHAAENCAVAIRARGHT